MSSKNKKNRQVKENLNSDQNLTAEEAAAMAAAEEAERTASEEPGKETDPDLKPDEKQTGETQAAPEETPADGKIKELNDRLLRNMAEFDNYRKRSEKEKNSMFDMGARCILEKLLPTIDNFERALKTEPEADNAFYKGMEMVYKDLMKNLSDAGVKPIECEGRQFDPAFHNAVMHEEDDSGEENVVTQELQKGYLYKDGVLRHSMVKVKN